MSPVPLMHALPAEFWQFDTMVNSQQTYSVGSYRTHRFNPHPMYFQSLRRSPILVAAQLDAAHELARDLDMQSAFFCKLYALVPGQFFGSSKTGTA